MAKRISMSRRGAAGIAAMALATPLTVAQPALAQLEEIVVTARQREENLFQAPLSLTSLSAEDLQQSNIRDINDLAAYTPGFYYTSQASFSASRLAPAYRFRGMNNSSPDPLQQQGGVFIDGVFLFGGAPSLTFEDIERVEVIKGPQSALFGRSTFSGAVNFITKKPADHFVASATAGVETRGTYDVSGSLEGPVIADRLSLRVTGARNVKGAHFKATDGGDIAQESTNALNVQAVITPTDKLELRIRRSDSWQDDSKSATVNMNAAHPLLANAPNRCRTGSEPYWCGAIPTVDDVPFAAISVATALNPPAFQTSNNPNLLVDILNNNTANPLVLGRMPYIKDVPHLNHAGLRGKYARNSFELKYDFDNGMTFTGDYVTSKLRTMTAQTSSGDRGNGWIISPNILTDSSASVRLASDTTERFSWSTGGNYFLQTSVGGANGVGGLPSVLDATRVATYREPVTFTGQGRLHYFGGFLALHYDLTDQLAADFEGRYQRERVTTSYQLVTQTTSAFSAFIPRVILTYKPNSELTTYASWARGALPGTDNSIVPLLSATLQAQIQAAPGYTVAVPAESVQNFELGVKQQTARFRYALTGYYMKWNNLKNRVSYTCPGNQCGPTVVNATVNITLAQTAKIYGVEAEVGVALTDAWDVNLSADYVHGRYDRFFQPLTLPHTGQTNASGKTILGFPEAQAALTSTYRGNFNADWGWYLRGGLTYTGRNYVEEVNQSWIAPSAKLNLRAGVEHGDTRIDFYVDNLTDNKQWIGGLRAVQSNYNVGPTVASQATATMVLPRLRTFGVRVSTKFQ